MSASDYHYLDVDEIVAETDKALYLDVDGERFWVPLSQIADADDRTVGLKNVTVGVTKWWANKHGFDVED